mmetsp:Transcript_23146/g.35253  ORF Transcript_23146/g.35253 Transcript_23146/m.35253 type:complete len:164 (+) Transcript_23146:225-716(+)
MPHTSLSLTRIVTQLVWPCVKKTRPVMPIIVPNISPILIVHLLSILSFYIFLLLSSSTPITIPLIGYTPTNIILRKLHRPQNKIQRERSIETLGILKVKPGSSQSIRKNFIDIRLLVILLSLGSNLEECTRYDQSSREGGGECRDDGLDFPCDGYTDGFAEPV